MSALGYKSGLFHSMFEAIPTCQKPRKAPKPRRLGGEWAKLAAETESGQALLRTLFELEFDESFYAVPEALNLRAA